MPEVLNLDDFQALSESEKLEELKALTPIDESVLLDIIYYGDNELQFYAAQNPGATDLVFEEALNTYDFDIVTGVAMNPRANEDYLLRAIEMQNKETIMAAIFNDNATAAVFQSAIDTGLPEIELTLAKHDNIPATILDKLNIEDNDIQKALAQNPNSSSEILEKIAHQYPMSDRFIAGEIMSHDNIDSKTIKALVNRPQSPAMLAIIARTDKADEEVITMLLQKRVTAVLEPLLYNPNLSREHLHNLYEQSSGIIEEKQAEVHRFILEHPQSDPVLLQKMLEDPNVSSSFKAKIANNPNATEQQLHQLIEMGYPNILYAIAKSPNANDVVHRAIIDKGNSYANEEIARNGKLSDANIDALLSEYYTVLPENKNLNSEQVQKLFDWCKQGVANELTPGQTASPADALHSIDIIAGANFLGAFAGNLNTPPEVLRSLLLEKPLEATGMRNYNTVSYLSKENLKSALQHPNTSNATITDYLNHIREAELCRNDEDYATLENVLVNQNISRETFDTALKMKDFHPYIGGNPNTPSDVLLEILKQDYSDTEKTINIYEKISQNLNVTSEALQIILDKMAENSDFSEIEKTGEDTWNLAGNPDYINELIIRNIINNSTIDVEVQKNALKQVEYKHLVKVRLGDVDIVSDIKKNSHIIDTYAEEIINSPEYNIRIKTPILANTSNLSVLTDEDNKKNLLYMGEIALNPATPLETLNSIMNRSLQELNIDEWLEFTGESAVGTSEHLLNARLSRCKTDAMNHKNISEDTLISALYDNDLTVAAFAPLANNATPRVIEEAIKHPNPHIAMNTINKANVSASSLDKIYSELTADNQLPDPKMIDAIVSAKNVSFKLQKKILDEYTPSTESILQIIKKTEEPRILRAIINSESGNDSLVQSQMLNIRRIDSSLLAEIAEKVNAGGADNLSESNRVINEILAHPSADENVARILLLKAQENPEQNIAIIGNIMNSKLITVASIDDASIQGVSRYRRELKPIYEQIANEGVTKITEIARNTGIPKDKVNVLLTKAVGEDTVKKWRQKNEVDAEQVMNTVDYSEYSSLAILQRNGPQSINGTDHSISFFHNDLADIDMSKLNTTQVHSGHPPGFAFSLVKFFNDEDNRQAAIITEIQSDAMSVFFTKSKKQSACNIVGENNYDKVREQLIPLKNTWYTGVLRNTMRQLYDSGVEKIYAITPEATQDVLNAYPPKSVLDGWAGKKAAQAEGFGAKTVVNVDGTEVTVWDAIERNSITAQDILWRNENDLVHGFTKKGEIYLTVEGMNAETKIHEYTHLWDIAMQELNPELWQQGVALMMKTSTWDEVLKDPNYKSIHGNIDAMASEVHARLVGKIGEQRLQAMLEEKKATKGLVRRVKKWNKESDQWTQDTFFPWTKEEAQQMTLEDFLDMPLQELLKDVPVQENTQSRKNALQNTPIDTLINQALAEKDITVNSVTQSQAQKLLNKTLNREVDDMHEAVNFAVKSNVRGQLNEENNYGLEPIVEHHFNDKMKGTTGRLDKVYLHIPQDVLDNHNDYFNNVIGVEKSPFTYTNKEGQEKYVWACFTFPEVLAENPQLQQFTKIPSTTSGTSQYNDAEDFIFQHSFAYKGKGLTIDGKWHELTDPSSNSPKKTKASYVASQTHDGEIILTIHDFRNGQNSTYTSFDYQSEKQNNGIRAIRMCQIRQSQQLAHISEITKHQEAAEASQKFFQFFTEPLDPQRNTSPYLQNKHVPVYGPMAIAKEKNIKHDMSDEQKAQIQKANKNRLKTIYLPLYQLQNTNGLISTSIRSYQSIDADGDKRLRANGQKKGNFYPLIPVDKINHELTQIAVGEGYSTCASFHRATSVPTFMAHDAGNMAPVVKSLLENLPNVKEVVLLIDNDYSPKEIESAKKENRKVVNPGLDTCLAIKSALADANWQGNVVLTGTVAINNSKTDLNDFDVYYGTEKGTQPYNADKGTLMVKRCFEQQRQEQLAGQPQKSINNENNSNNTVSAPVAKNF